ncbi:hypothetical protein XFLAVUS301_15600 [Xanthobacter flavus]|uniref:Uncharacterized protein n=1 Tax=Xanthobacter flavus TaxID=281 RepID=A0A9W6FJ51_XANFL|nr:hypothetical protein XFLAVUS301_15600 [Xanthobacter flavus]
MDQWIGANSPERDAASPIDPLRRTSPEEAGISPAAEHGGAHALLPDPHARTGHRLCAVPLREMGACLLSLPRTAYEVGQPATRVTDQGSNWPSTWFALGGRRRKPAPFVHTMHTRMCAQSDGSYKAVNFVTFATS